MPANTYSPRDNQGLKPEAKETELKKHITQQAIEAVVLAYRDARNSKNHAATAFLGEYFQGKMVGLVEAFAFMTNQSWIDADAMLCQRANAMDKVK